MTKRARNLLNTRPTPTPHMRQLLEQIAPNDEALEEALKRIEEAVFIYIYSHINDTGITPIGNVRKTRKSLVDLEKALTKALDATQKLTYIAVSLLDKTNRGSREDLAARLRQAHLAVIEARDKALGLPDKQRDGTRNILAWEIACIFVEVLKKTPTATRDVVGQDHYPRGGAVYARVLREALAMGGVELKDIGHEIDRGLLMLWATSEGRVLPRFHGRFKSLKA